MLRNIIGPLFNFKIVFFFVVFLACFFKKSSSFCRENEIFENKQNKNNKNIGPLFNFKKGQKLDSWNWRWWWAHLTLVSQYVLKLRSPTATWNRSGFKSLRSPRAKFQHIWRRFGYDFEELSTISNRTVLFKGKKPTPQKTTHPTNEPNEDSLPEQFAQVLSSCILFNLKERGRTTCMNSSENCLRKLFLLVFWVGFLLQAVLQGVSFHGGASFKVEKPHYAARKKDPENRKNEVKLPPPLCAAPWSTLWLLLILVGIEIAERLRFSAI